MRQIVREIKALTVLGDEELYNAAKVHGAPYELVRIVAKAGKLPVPNFSAGGIATPADASLMMQLGAETVFVGSGIFMKGGADPLDVGVWHKQDADIGLCTSSEVGQQRNPDEHAEAISRAKAIVLATLHYNNPKVVAEASEAVLGSMKGLAAAAIDEADRMQTRGW